MLYDNIKISEGADVENLNVDSGAIFPIQSSLGELFYYTGTGNSGPGLYVFKSSGWDILKSGTQTAASDATFIVQQPSASLGFAQALSNLPTGVVRNTTGTGVLSSGPVDLSSSTYTTGVLRTASFPALSGDVTTTAGSTLVTLAASGVMSGTGFTKFDVDSKGRILSASKPTKLNQYYIDNAVATDVTNAQTIAGPLVASYAFNPATTSSKELVTKEYVDTITSGLTFKESVRAATVANISLVGTQVVDGVTLNLGDRVLVKDQSLALENGIYVVDSGIWTRSVDAVGPNVKAGMYTFVEEGTTNADTGWILATNNPIVVGSSNLLFTQFTSLGQITAGAGLSKTGSILNIGGTTDRISINADNIDISPNYAGQTSIVTLGTISSGAWNASTISSAFGGTGFSSYTVGEMLYASNGTSLAKIAPNTSSTKKFLTQTSSGSPSWAVLTDAEIPSMLISKTLVGSSTWNGNTIQPEYGGTGLSTVGTANSVLSSTGTGNEYRDFSSNTGVNFTYTSETIRIDTPQDLRTSASPNFLDVYLAGQQSGYALQTGASGKIEASSVTNSQLSWLRGIYINSRTLPAVVGDSIDIGYFLNNSSNTFAGEIDLMYHSASGSIVKKYIISARNNHTNGAWWEVKPISSTGGNGTVDFEMDANVNSSQAQFRIRKTLGTAQGDVKLQVTTFGSLNNFNASSSSYSSPATGTLDTRNISLTSSIYGVLTPQNGGTGISSYNYGDLIYADGVNSLTTLPAEIPGHVLVSGSIPSWNKVALGYHTVGDFVASITNGTSGVETGTSGLSLTGGGGAGPSMSIALANSGITPGTYTKLTVDARGRAITGSTLVAADIPNLDWSKITTSKPTTLAGYGITDSYTKTEIDNIITGLDFKKSVKVATTSNIILSGTQMIDGINLAVGDRVLVKNQSDATQNGIYDVATGAWSRSSDADNSPVGEVTSGMYTYVESGTVNGSSGWVLSSQSPITIGSSVLTFTQFSGLGQISTGAGLMQYGNTIALTTTGVTAGSNYNKFTVDTFGRISNATAEPYLTSNQNITITGDASGTGSTAISLTLANSGVTAGTYTKITVDAKGRATAGSSLVAADIPNLDWSKITTGKPTTLSGYGITDAQPLDADLSAIASVSGTSGILKKTAADTWALDTNAYLTSNQNITISGDASGTGTTAIALTLANSGVTAGTYTKLTVDAKGRATVGGSLVAADIPNLDWSKITTGKPTTLAGYGITNAISTTGGSIVGTLYATMFRATQGSPDANDSSTVGYAFGPDGDTGLFSAGSGAANGVVSIYSNNSEKIRVDGLGTQIKSALTVTGAITQQTAPVPSINPVVPKDGDIKVDVGPIVSIYAAGAWRQIFPAVYG